MELTQELEQYAAEALAQREAWAHGLPQPEHGVIRTQIVRVLDKGPEPQPPMQTGADNAQPVYGREGGAFYTVWNRDDAQGNSFECACTGLVENNNITWLEVFYTPRGGPFPQRPSYRIDPTWKIDDMHCKVSRRADNPARADLVFILSTHTVGLPNRYIFLELAVLENVYAFDPAYDFLAEAGVGGFRGGGIVPTPEPDPGMTEAEMEEILRRVLGVESGTLLGNFGAGGNVRVALEQKMLDGMRDANNAGLPPDTNGIATRAAEYRHFQRLQFAENMLWLLDPNNSYPAAGGVRYLLRYRTVEDGAYTAGMNAIRDSGLTKPAAQTRAAKIDLSANEEADEKAAADAALEELRQRWAVEAEAARKAMEQEQEQTPEGGE